MCDGHDTNDTTLTKEQAEKLQREQTKQKTLEAIAGYIKSDNYFSGTVTELCECLGIENNMVSTVGKWLYAERNYRANNGIRYTSKRAGNKRTIVLKAMHVRDQKP